MKESFKKKSLSLNCNCIVSNCNMSLYLLV